jgi:hypothetical protein
MTTKSALWLFGSLLKKKKNEKGFGKTLKVILKKQK